MRITVTSLFVEDQNHAFKFYTEVLGFLPKDDVPAGEYRWLTVVSPEDPEGCAILLEPNANPVAKTYQLGLVEQGIPANSFAVEDVQAEYERLIALGVNFTMQPTSMGPVTIAIFDDTCGNLLQIAQMG